MEGYRRGRSPGTQPLSLDRFPLSYHLNKFISLHKLPPTMPILHLSLISLSIYSIYIYTLKHPLIINLIIIYAIYFIVYVRL